MLGPSLRMKKKMRVPHHPLGSHRPNPSTQLVFSVVTFTTFLSNTQMRRRNDPPSQQQRHFVYGKIEVLSCSKVHFGPRRENTRLCCMRTVQKVAGQPKHLRICYREGMYKNSQNISLQKHFNILSKAL